MLDWVLPRWKMNGKETRAKGVFKFLKIMILQYTVINFLITIGICILITLSYVKGEPSEKHIFKVKEFLLIIRSV